MRVREPAGRRMGPMKAFGSLIEFLQLPGDRARLKKAIEFASFKQLRQQESEEDFIESPFTK